MPAARQSIGTEIIEFELEVIGGCCVGLLCLMDKPHAAPAHPPGHPLDRFPVSPCPCARGIPSTPDLPCLMDKPHAAPAHTPGHPLDRFPVSPCPCARGIPSTPDLPCLMDKPHAAPAHTPGHPLDRFPVSPCPCARGIPFILNIKKAAGLSSLISRTASRTCRHPPMLPCLSKSNTSLCFRRSFC